VSAGRLMVVHRRHHEHLTGGRLCDDATSYANADSLEAAADALNLPLCGPRPGSQGRWHRRRRLLRVRRARQPRAPTKPAPGPGRGKPDGAPRTLLGVA
jgi:hypothetical protein